LLNLLPENAAIMPTDKPKSKHSMLPLLIVLFLVSYGLLTLLVVEQGRTIDAQRYLIRQLFQDSTRLSALQGQAVLKQHAKAEAKAKAKAQAEAGSKTPSSQAVPQEEASRKPSGKVRRPLPQKPPEDASEPADERRTLLSI
jgi:hypothetical protein